MHYYEGLTPNHVAAATGRLSLLISIEEKLNEKYPKDIEGLTPLHYSAEYGHLEVCKYILGAPFWVMGSITDGIMVNPEEIYFGEEVPIDFV